ncbi:hypothetical protein KI387_013456, partial [Taxus chinensis]
RRFSVLQMWDHHFWIAELERSMHRRDRLSMAILLEVVGLGPMSQIPSITLDHGLLTALAEKWRSESQCFRFPTREMIVTLEDVWWILHVLIIGTLIEYNSDVGLIRATCSDIFDVDDIPHNRCLTGTGTETIGPSASTSSSSKSKGPRAGPIIQSTPGTSLSGTDSHIVSGTDSHSIVAAIARFSRERHSERREE